MLYSIMDFTNLRFITFIYITEFIILIFMHRGQQRDGSNHTIHSPMAGHDAISAYDTQFDNTRQKRVG